MIIGNDGVLDVRTFTVAEMMPIMLPANGLQRDSLDVVAPRHGVKIC